MKTPFFYKSRNTFISAILKKSDDKYDILNTYYDVRFDFYPKENRPYNITDCSSVETISDIYHRISQYLTHDEPKVPGVDEAIRKLNRAYREAMQAAKIKAENSASSTASASSAQTTAKPQDSNTETQLA